MATPETSPPGRQTRLLAILAAALLALLAGGYFMFLRTDYVLLYGDLRASDAAALVTELERRGVSYKLADGGASILVPTAEADNVRIGVAGANLPMNGEVGFELFNESSMGLTEFAQKINYQRALQGELSRTIMAMDGVEMARVHLALPERALFRGSRSEPRAAVTVIAKRGRVIDEARVTGIQRLVASSISDLTIANVIVLDGLGRIISASGPDPLQQPALPPELASAQADYLARTRAAVAGIDPGASYEVRLALVPLAALAAPPQGAARLEPRPFLLRIAIVTATPLPAEKQQLVLAALGREVGLDESAGDSLSFSIGSPSALAGATAAPVVAAPIAEARPLPAAIPPARAAWVPESWPLILAALALLAVMVVGARRSRRSERAEREAFATRIRGQIASRSEAHAA